MYTDAEKYENSNLLSQLFILLFYHTFINILTLGLCGRTKKQTRKQILTFIPHEPASHIHSTTTKSPPNII
jgi:hypothetical protein